MNEHEYYLDVARDLEAKEQENVNAEAEMELDRLIKFKIGDKVKIDISVFDHEYWFRQWFGEGIKYIISHPNTICEIVEIRQDWERPYILSAEIEGTTHILFGFTENELIKVEEE